MMFVYYTILSILEKEPDVVIYDMWLIEPIIRQTIVEHSDGTVHRYCYIVKSEEPHVYKLNGVNP